MKTLFIALLIVNITLVAYDKLDLHTNPADIKPEVNAGQVKIVAPDELNSRVKPQVQAVAMVCFEWSGFPESDVGRVEQVLGVLQLGEKIKKRQHEVAAGYAVYIPPLKTKTDAEKKSKELEALGITEYFLVQDESNLRNSISLGVFKTEDAALNYLAQLKDKGVRSARVGVRNQLQTYFVLESVAQTLLPRLNEMQKDFPVSEVKTIDCKILEKPQA